MDPSGLQRSYTYRHMSRSQSLALNDLRAATAQLDTCYMGTLVLTQSEYCLLLPLLNPIVICWNTRHYRRLCRTADLAATARRQMLANLLLVSLLGFIPIVNIIFTRRFKCNMRNLAIVESQLQANEDKTFYHKDGATTDDAPLPAHIERLFNKCPVFKRGDQASIADAQRNSPASVYSSPRTSLSDLGYYKEAAFAASMNSMQTDDVASTVIDIADGSSHEPKTLESETIANPATTKDATTIDEAILEQSPAGLQSWLYAPVAYMASWIWGTETMA
ncbi:hypothetical protein GGI04_004990 [Coemansia thaxteri]|uniref:Uncharacterized protein n=1 Tax=Coemansia thaxteri TaxID=2663907 RepID=A0A9W8BN38_9FUNG|nr:hypothetical protein GGI04_004990 [Coemansia thaxteri]KAJ2007558.1 hypothetical protein H4R26_000695 [Coemansia thaxteri]KAJ2465307.1 hypothetical protein GGI02_004736 [Coemansia sp. RSA 2322]KAJ2487783.1 hypothetical protein EV174_000316 [Coemansia sp. RSA 2320]